MAKVYPATTKYVIHVNFAIDGNVDEADIVGAIFGQTEGLFGDQYDLRELQRAGKIGRLLVTIKGKLNNQTHGEIEVPSSMDKTDTALIASMIESVDRVGPHFARFTVSQIEDIRSIKRTQIVKRAKELLEKMKEETPESSEIKEQIIEELSQAEIIHIGVDENKLPAGPEVIRKDVGEIILVEGKADLLNLMKHGIKNVIAIGGVREKVPEFLADMTKRKTTIVFADGDKGGEMFIKTLISQLDVDYVTRAPEGKEVEELTFKEIIRCLQRKSPVKENEEENIKTELESEEDYINLAISKVRNKQRIAVVDVKNGIEQVFEVFDDLLKHDIKNKIIVTGVPLNQKQIQDLYFKGVKLIYTTSKIEASFIPSPMQIRTVV